MKYSSLFPMLMSMVTTLLSAMTAMAFYTLSERKLLGYMQHRKGPNKPSIIATMVPMADAIKLFLKEQKQTTMMNMKTYLISPMVMIMTALLLWPLFPYPYTAYFMKFSALYFLTITSINVYATFMAGWSSSAKWALLGALRGVAQTISYEVSLSLIIIYFMLYPSSMNFLHMSQNYYSLTLIASLPLSVSWLMSILAETHRAPLDFAEGESELVSGFNTEYSSSVFALIFMAEYMNILLMSLITVSIMFNNDYTMELIIKTTILSIIFIWSRGALPRMRYDKLMNILWKKILPLSLMMVTLSLSIMTAMNWYCTDLNG